MRRKLSPQDIDREHQRKIDHERRNIRLGTSQYGERSPGRVKEKARDNAKRPKR